MMSTLGKKKRRKHYNRGDKLSHDLWQLWSYLSRRRRQQLGWLLFLLILTSLSEMFSLGAIFPFLTALGNADSLLNDPQFQSLLTLFQIETNSQLVTWLGIIFIAVVLLANGLRLASLHVRIRLAASIGADISSRIYHITLRQPYSFHVRQNSSDLVQTLTVDTDRLTNNILIPLLMLLSNVVLIPALIIALLLIDSRIALGSAVVLGSAYIIIYYTRQRLLKQNSKTISQSSQQKIKIVQEGIGGIRDVLLGNSQAFFEHVYTQTESSFKQATATNYIVSQAPTYIIESLALSAILLLALGLGQGEDFSKAIPVLGSLALGSKKLLPALQLLFSSLAKIQGSRTSLLRVLIALRRSSADMPAMAMSVEPLQLERELRFDQVWFRYSNETNWVLRNLNLTIRPKTTVGFVGSTGSGKSTTADLILGLLQPQKGIISVDGLPLEEEQLKRWQCSIAHVPQNIFLADGTIAENIAFGIPQSQIDLKKIQEAARLAQVEEFIDGLPAGYKTYVGERGIRLSGGQRQRIGIARALYQQASIIVFDEATSALDNATEKEVMSAIDALNGEFTIILIAHRLSTLERCNSVVELNQGQVVFQGSYQELTKCSMNFQKIINKI